MFNAYSSSDSWQRTTIEGFDGLEGRTERRGFGLVTTCRCIDWALKLTEYNSFFVSSLMTNSLVVAFRLWSLGKRKDTTNWSSGCFQFKLKTEWASAKKF